MPPFYENIKGEASRIYSEDIQVVVRVGKRLTVVFPDAEIDVGDTRDDALLMSGLKKVGGNLVPFADWIPLAGSTNLGAAG